MKPQMQVVKIQYRCHMLAGSPNAHDTVGGSGQFSPEFQEMQELLFGE